MQQQSANIRHKKCMFIVSKDYANFRNNINKSVRKAYFSFTFFNIYIEVKAKIDILSPTPPYFPTFLEIWVSVDHVSFPLNTLLCGMRVGGREK